jgi:hypothetical protein
MTTLAEAFEARVHRIPDCECWLWGGNINPSHGYGEYQPARGVRWRAHRLSFMLHNGPLVDGLVIMHSCDNRWCVNPAHLTQGTHADNERDCVAKGRHYKQKRTHCPQGHQLGGENVRRTCGGRWRQCRECYLMDQRRRRIARQATTKENHHAV